MFFEKLREQINLKIYASKDAWLRFGKILNAILIFCAIIVLIGTWGFEETAVTKKWRFIAIQASFSAYILNYALRIIFNFNFKKFIKDTWFELVLVIYLILDAVVFHITGHLLFERLFRAIGIRQFARQTY